MVSIMLTCQGQETNKTLLYKLQSLWVKRRIPYKITSVTYKLHAGLSQSSHQIMQMCVWSLFSVRQAYKYSVVLHS